MELLIKEKQRRQKLSAALAGRTAWNKGKKHTEETRQRIKERTVEAMKNPKVLAKLKGASMQSYETRSKIKASMLRSWEQRKKMKLVQERCVEEWKEYIADCARRGVGSDITYSWNSYEAIVRKRRCAWKLQNKGRCFKETSASKNDTSSAVNANGIDFNHVNCANTILRANWGKKDSKGYKMGKGMSKGPKRIVQACDAMGNDHNSEASKNGSIMGPCKQLKKCNSSYAYKNPSNVEKLKRLKEIRAMRRLRQNNERMELIETDRRIALERARVLMAKAQIITSTLEAQTVTDEGAFRFFQDACQLLAEAETLLKTAHLQDNCTDFHN